MKTANKLVGAWVVMTYEGCKPHSNLLMRVCGPILESNYLPSMNFEMPVRRDAFEGIQRGDKIKVVCWTHKNELDAFKNGQSAGFTDVGVRYFLEVDNAWKLVWED